MFKFITVFFLKWDFEVDPDQTGSNQFDQFLIELLGDDFCLPLGHQPRPDLEEGDDDAGQDEDDGVNQAQVHRILRLIPGRSHFGPHLNWNIKSREEFIKAAELRVRLIVLSLVLKFSQASIFPVLKLTSQLYFIWKKPHMSSPYS